MSLKLNFDMSRNKVLLGISLDEVATLQSLIDQHSNSVVDLEITSDTKSVIEKRLHQIVSYVLSWIFWLYMSACALLLRILYRFRETHIVFACPSAKNTSSEKCNTGILRSFMQCDF